MGVALPAPPLRRKADVADYLYSLHAIGASTMHKNKPEKSRSIERCCLDGKGVPGVDSDHTKDTSWSAIPCAYERQTVP